MANDRALSVSPEDLWPLAARTARLFLGAAARGTSIALTDVASPAVLRRYLTIWQRAANRRRVIWWSPARGESMPAAVIEEPRRDALVLLEGLESIPRAAQSEVASLLGTREVLSTSSLDAHALAELWDPDSLAAIAPVLISAPALATQPERLPDLIRERVVQLGSRLALPHAEIARDACAALTASALAGDVAELDALLTRGLLAAEALGEPFDARLLGQDPRFAENASLPTPVASDGANVEPPRPGPAATLAPAGTPAALERLGIELAHQLKNPLVTLKTFVQNAPRLAERPLDFASFAGLANDAVARIDAVVDQMLAFARLAPRDRREVDVVAALRAALSSRDADLTRKGVDVRGADTHGFPARIATETLDLALATLAAHVAETIEPRSALEVSTDGRPALHLSYRACGLPTHIDGITDGHEGGFPLPLLLVRGALESQGGRLSVERNGAETRLSMEFDAG